MLAALALLAEATIVAQAGPAPGAEASDPRADWDFAFTDFVIAAWSPPPATDADYRLVKDAHFNLVMSPRYELPDESLRLAEKHGLKVMIDTYTPNDKPWGGTASEYRPHPTHHPATLPELSWLHERYGRHPALAGYLLGDDYGALPPELVETTDFLRENAPHLFPWICQNSFQPKNLADNGNPIADPQLYPTLYQRNLPRDQQCALLCDLLDRLRKASNRLNMIPWPMFNVTGVESDSLIRFQPYACLAYGAQGIWYFTYACLIERDDDGAPLPTPGYAVVRDVNARVEAWGPELLGRRSTGVFTTGLETEEALPPGDGLLVRSADDDLLVGVLTRNKADVLAMVVDTRGTPGPEQPPDREVSVTFDRAVGAVTVVPAPGTEERTVDGQSVRLSLPAGGGQLLRLRGDGVRELAERLERTRKPAADMPPLGPDSLMARWSFDEGAGEVAHDSSGLGNDLTLANASWADGKIGRALNLTGEGSLGTRLHARLPDVEAMSIEAWVKPVEYPTEGYGCVLYVGRGSTSRFEFGFGPDSIYPVITNGYEFAHGNLYVSGMKQLIPPGTWGHIAVVAGPDGAATYVNGERVRSTDFVGVFDFWGDRIELGSRNGREEFEGFVDEIRIWGRELTQEEVREHYQQPD